MESQTTILWPTILWLTAGCVLAIAASIGDRARRRAPFAWYAYLPWHGLVFLGFVMALFAAVHLYGLARG